LGQGCTWLCIAVDSRSGCTEYFGAAKIAPVRRALAGQCLHRMSFATRIHAGLVVLTILRRECDDCDSFSCGDDGGLKQSDQRDADSACLVLSCGPVRGVGDCWPDFSCCQLHVCDRSNCPWTIWAFAAGSPMVACGTLSFAWLPVCARDCRVHESRTGSHFPDELRQTQSSQCSMRLSRKQSFDVARRYPVIRVTWRSYLLHE
jgi:hypothetical protein